MQRSGWPIHLLGFSERAEERESAFVFLPDTVSSPASASDPGIHSSASGRAAGSAGATKVRLPTVYLFFKDSDFIQFVLGTYNDHIHYRESASVQDRT